MLLLVEKSANMQLYTTSELRRNRAALSRGHQAGQRPSHGSWRVPVSENIPDQGFNHRLAKCFVDIPAYS